MAMRRLPPLAAVRAFEAAARHRSFTLAAAELGMTQAAISYQIKLIEEHLGASLFQRVGRGVTLTPAGQRAAPQVSRAFDQIDAAFAEIRGESEGLLTVSTTNTFANTWLAWRLGAFQMRHPELAVRLLTSDALVDFAADDVDVAIRAGRGGWDGLVALRLLDIDFTPMCSPEFLARHGGSIAPTEIPRLSLISPHDPWWPFWLNQMGIEMPAGIERRGLRLDSQSHEGAAAMAGQGIAMLTPFFWRQDIADGRLVRLSDHTATRGYAYWLVYPERRRSVLKIRRFRDWLAGEFDRTIG